jgi:hypothetical protein
MANFFAESKAMLLLHFAPCKRMRSGMALVVVIVAAPKNPF